MKDEIITGIDIGSSKIAVLVAKLSPDEQVPRVLGFSSVDSHGVKRGQIVDINRVVRVVENAVEAAERMAGAKIQSSYVSIGGPHIQSLNSQGVVAVSNPNTEITGEDVLRVIDAAKAISLSSTREIIEVVPREFIVDGQDGINNPVGMSGVRLEVNTHIITASLTNLRNVDRCLSDLGIKTNGYIFSGMASSLSSVTDTEKELGIAVVDIGGGKIDICIYTDGALSYSSSVPFGARHITNDIAVGLRISLDSAEKVKLFLSSKDVKKQLTEEHVGKTSKDDIDVSKLGLTEDITKVSYKTVVEGIIRPRLEEIFEEILSHIERSGFVTAIPSGLVLVGGGALTVGTVEAAKRIVGVPARIGVPGNMTGLIDEVIYPQYSCVAGLLLYSQHDESQRQGLDFKDFDKILRNFSLTKSYKKITDLFKSFIP